MGGPNCLTFRPGVYLDGYYVPGLPARGSCLSNTSSGPPWIEWTFEGTACPDRYAFGTRFVLPGGETFTCVDRGSDVVVNADGTFWLDLMVVEPPVPYGTVMTVDIIEPVVAE